MIIKKSDIDAALKRERNQKRRKDFKPIEAKIKDHRFFKRRANKRGMSHPDFFEFMCNLLREHEREDPVTTRKMSIFNENRLRTVMDTCELIFWCTDANFKTTHNSDGWSRMTALPVEDSLNLGWLTTVHPEDKPRILSSSQRAFQERKPFCVQWRMNRARKGWVPMICIATAQYDRNEFLGYLGAAIEFTDGVYSDYDS